MSGPLYVDYQRDSNDTLVRVKVEAATGADWMTSFVVRAYRDANGNARFDDGEDAGRSHATIAQPSSFVELSMGVRSGKGRLRATWEAKTVSGAYEGELDLERE